MSPANWSLTILGVIAAGKEIVYDNMMGRGMPDNFDLLYTLAGGAAGGLTITVFHNIFMTETGSFNVDLNSFSKRVSLLYTFRY